MFIYVLSLQLPQNTVRTCCATELPCCYHNTVITCCVTELPCCYHNTVRTCCLTELPCCYHNTVRTCHCYSRRPTPLWHLTTQLHLPLLLTTTHTTVAPTHTITLATVTHDYPHPCVTYPHNYNLPVATATHDYTHSCGTYSNNYTCHCYSRLPTPCATYLHNYTCHCYSRRPTPLSYCKLLLGYIVSSQCTYYRMEVTQPSTWERKFVLTARSEPT